MKIKVLLIIIFLIFLSCIASGQKMEKKITLSGVVLDSLERPVNGAIIFIDNNKTNYTTDAQGYYRIRVKPGARKIMVLSLLKGFSESNIDGRTTINFTLFSSRVIQPGSKNNNGKDETVEVGYGTMKTQNVISGKASTNSPKFSTYSNIFEMIRSEVPGAQVRGTSVFLQGVTSIGSSSAALFVVDGVVVNQINDILPNDVKSIEVLKGPSAAVYGIQGANGVIFIITKK
jgi:TonB-dependent SusC/RagA subfamily outer membrane receptor